MPVTRFAPSPNGSLHLGHAYSAIIAHDLAHTSTKELPSDPSSDPSGDLSDDLSGGSSGDLSSDPANDPSGYLAGQSGGRFLLRIEDIDGARSRAELADEFRRDLEWLGLEWEEVPAQSTRLASYEAAAERLKEMGLLYPCVCTRAQIAENAARSGPEGPIYPGTCKGKNIAGERPVAWRLDVEKALKMAVARAEGQALMWGDALAGPQRADPALLGDVVLLRKDAPASYHLAASLDDALDGVSLVTRGSDLFTATHIHRLLQSVLGLAVPRWHHHGLLCDAEGKKLAKSRGSLSLKHRREIGENGRALADHLRQGGLPTGISLKKV